MTMNRSGVSVILAQDIDEVTRLIKKLGVQDAFPVADIAQAVQFSSDPVVWAVLDSKEAAERLASALHVKRGVISWEGKITYLGFNRDWMCKTLTRPQPVQTDNQTGFEKEDPYESLGYTRR